MLSFIDFYTPHWKKQMMFLRQVLRFTLMVCLWRDTTGAFKSCRIHRIYKLRELTSTPPQSCYSSGKLESPEFLSWGRVSEKRDGCNGRSQILKIYSVSKVDEINLKKKKFMYNKSI